MAVYSTIKKTGIGPTHRIDAEYYKPVYKKLEKKLESAIPLANLLSEPIKNGQDIRDFSEEYSVPYIRTGDFDDRGYNPENSKFIKPPGEVKVDINPGDIIFARKGNFGKIDVVQEEFLPAVISSEIMRLRLKDGIDPEYFVSFMRSKLGYLQILRSIHGVSNFSITQDALRNIKVARFSDDKELEISKLVKKSNSINNKSKKIYSKAERLLLDKLDLLDYSPQKKLTYETSYSKVVSAKRLDADYFQPKYKDLKKKINDYKAEPITEVVNRVSTNFDPQEYPNKEFKYVELSNIDPSTGTITGFSNVTGENAPGRAKRKLKTGDVLVSSLSGSFDKIALVTENHDGCLASSGFFQFRDGDILPEVLLVLARSPIVKMQLRRESSGTIMSSVPKSSIENINIPVLSNSSQKEVARLVKRSHRELDKAKNLLDDAKNKVENLIEEEA